MAAFFMKNIRSCSRLLVPIIFALALSLSCDRRVNEQLDSIEDSLSTDPADAYEKLTSISTKQLRSKSTQARYALLMSLAMDKNYIDTDNDSLIRVAVNYYQDGRNTSYKMLSFYSLGIVQRNAHKTTAAIVSFLKSEELAAELSDYHYLGLVYRNMAALYRKCHDVDQELRYFQKSVAAFDKEGASLYSAYSQLEEARAFMGKGMFSRADSVLRSVETFARNNNDHPLLRYVLVDRAINKMSSFSDYRDAHRIISFYSEADKIGGGQKETVDYGTLARAYDKMNVPDSVAHYLTLAKSSAKTSLDSVHLCNTLAAIFSSHGDFRSANEQYVKGVDIHNRMVFNQEHQKMANAISEYNREEANQQSLLARNRLRMLVFLCLFIIALIIIIVLSVNLWQRQVSEKNRIIKEKDRKIEEDIAQIQEIADELRISRTGQSEMSQRINSLIQDKIAIVKMCADAYEAVKNEKKTKDPYHYLDEDPLQRKTEQMQQFLSALDKFRSDDSLFSLLEDSVNAAQSDIMIHLREACEKNKMEKPQFEEHDFRMLMLFYAGIPDRTVAFLMDMSFASVRTRKTRYKERLLRPDIVNGPFFVQKLTSIR